MTLLSGFAGLMLPRRAVRGCCEVRVAEPAAPALCDEHALPGCGHVGEFFSRSGNLGIVDEDERANWNVDFEIFAFSSGFQRAFAVSAALRFELGSEPEVDECVAMGICDEVHRAAATTVATVRPTAGNELLATKAERAASPVSGSNVNVDFIDEHK
jgi:hypothetical protein